MCLILRALKATDSLVVVRPCGHLRIVRERCVAAAGIFGSASKASKNAAGEFIEPLKDSKSVLSISLQEEQMQECRRQQGVSSYIPVDQ